MARDLIPPAGRDLAPPEEEQAQPRQYSVGETVAAHAPNAVMLGLAPIAAEAARTQGMETVPGSGTFSAEPGIEVPAKTAPGPGRVETAQALRDMFTQHPGAAIGAGVVGAAGSPAALASPASAFGRFRLGALLGGLAGFGGSTGKTMGERASDAAVPAAFGGVAGASIPWLAGKLLGSRAGATAEDISQQAGMANRTVAGSPSAPGMRGGISAELRQAVAGQPPGAVAGVRQKLAEEGMRMRQYGLTSGVLTTPEKVLERSQNLIEQVGPQIGKTVEQYGPLVPPEAQVTGQQLAAAVRAKIAEAGADISQSGEKYAGELATRADRIEKVFGARPVPLSELHDQTTRLGKDIYNIAGSKDPLLNPTKEALSDVRGIFSDEVAKQIDAAGGSSPAWALLRDKYHVAAQAMKLASKAVATNEGASKGRLFQMLAGTLGVGTTAGGHPEVGLPILAAEGAHSAWKQFGPAVQATRLSLAAGAPGAVQAVGRAAASGALPEEAGAVASTLGGRLPFGLPPRLAAASVPLESQGEGGQQDRSGYQGANAHHGDEGNTSGPQRPVPLELMASHVPLLGQAGSKDAMAAAHNQLAQTSERYRRIMRAVGSKEKP